MKLAAASITAIAFAGDAVADDQASVFAGRMVSDGWEDVFLSPGHLDWRNSGLLGLAYGRDWQVTPRLSFGLEGQVVGHFGEQQHAEFNLPLFIRYAPDGFGPLESAAFGMGPSLATEVPEIEVDTKGGSERLLLYWAIELEFASPRPGTSIYGRLHHRSNGWGRIAEQGGSNAIVMGLRRRW